MQIKRVVVTGEPFFLNRHQFLFTEMAAHLNYLEFIPRENEWYEWKPVTYLIKAFYAARMRSLSKANSLFQKNQHAFVLKSKRAERRIKQLEYTPDFIFHIFSTYSPFWTQSEIPYAMYLDYTMGLAEQAWLPWASFINRQERDAWFACERRAYERSHHIFTMSTVVKNSLIQDYGIDAHKITAVGASGSFREPYSGIKTFGTQQILFNGSDFERKGGDVVLEAFKLVKNALPNAKLVIIGKAIETEIEGIENPGNIASFSDLEKIFLSTDLVVAPARCEPFGVFIVEAMNYGVPCIVSTNPWNGIPEFLDHGVDSIIIDELDPKQLAVHMIDLLSDPNKLEMMSQAARLKVQTQLNWQHIAKNILSILSTQSNTIGERMLESLVM
jgi:glycosyltransferase involved in cell wall biosynthesis